MEIDKKLIEQVASLSRLNLTEAEKEQFVKDFKEILAAFSDIDKCDTSDVKPSIQPVHIPALTREDKATPCLSQQDALKNSSNNKDGYFKGPRAI